MAEEVYPPCYVGCPVHTNNQKLVEHVVNGRYESALEVLIESNPFVSVCGRICHHPCEQHCRRSKIEAPVGLRRLKRFIVEKTIDYRKERRKLRLVKPSKGKKVAIVGSGPSGMTAAHDLARKGYRVEVYEKSNVPGGLLGSALPRYRLPLDAVMEDIDDILSLGVKLKTGVEVGRDVTIGDFFNDGFGAVILATGLSESRNLNIPGIDNDNVLLALPFLMTARSPSPLELGKKIAVIGGGNVAIDVARTAKRLGVERVVMVCLESKDEMPAWEWEVEEAKEEGIEIMNSWGPKRIFTEGKLLKGIELKRCIRVFDNSGGFNPEFDESITATLPVDKVIIAIGQRSNLSCINETDIKVERGRIISDPETLATSMKGVFLTGEVQIGPASAIESVREGHRVADAVDYYLENGQFIKLPREDVIPLGELPDEVVERVKRINPVEIQLPEPERRIRSFDELERPFTEQEALAEAKRCIACTTGALADEQKCAACLTCVRICPFGVATVERTAIMPQEKCQACGLCAAECPAAAIALKRFGTSKMYETLSKFFECLKLKDIKRPFIVSYCCLFEVTSRSFLVDHRDEEAGKYGVYKVMVPCVARLSVPDILSPLELGADGVAIIACSEGECLYPTAEERLLERVKEAKKLLEEVGVEPEVIDFWKTKESAEVSWTAFWEISRRKLKELLKNYKTIA